MSEIIEHQELMIKYLIDQLLNEYTSFNKNIPKYRLRQANTTLHNINCWYEDSVENPFNTLLLETYNDSGSTDYIDNRIANVKTQLLELIIIKKGI